MAKVGDSTYSISPSDRVVATSAPFTASRTWTLPAASNMIAGHKILVVDLAGAISGSNTLVIARAGADTINGSGASLTISSAFGAYYLVSDGAGAWNAQSLASIPVASIAGNTGAFTLSHGITNSGNDIQLSITLPCRPIRRRRPERAAQLAS
jgi:hypothetical protein